MRTTRITFVVACVAIVVALAAVLAGKVVAMDREELRNVPPQIRNWFESMKSPTGKLCCSYADGHRTEYDMRENYYWVPINQVWTPIPPEVVIYDVDLTMTLPASLSASSGMNAIAHSVEALYAQDANPIVSLMAREGI